MIEVHDKVEDIWAFWRHLPHDNFASMPCGSCKMVRVELLTQLESIENWLYDKLMDCSAGRWDVGALGGRHGV